MERTSENGFAWRCAIAIFVGAFLLFQVQPLISKMILPWFGGSPAVWTTCMLFFQVVLLAGYAYADGLARLGQPKRQALIHIPLLLIALAFLPISRAEYFKPDNSASPTWKILLLLGLSIGLPYFLLSTTGPLVQTWFARVYRARSPYRLYSLSNIGSLVALLSYPIVVEPLLTTRAQGWIWSAGFVIYALVVGWLAMTLRKHDDEVVPRSKKSKAPKDKSSSNMLTSRQKLMRAATWFLLPAFASMMLLAVTNHLCQGVAVVPFLWIVPLSLYLLSFIICFDREQWYKPTWYGLGTVIVVLVISNMVLSRYLSRIFPDANIQLPFGAYAENVRVQIILYLAALFLICMTCHGELVRSKPSTEKLTTFYLMISAGGAAGGLFVALLCPWIFSSFFEMKLGLIVSFLIGVVVVGLYGWKTWLFGENSESRLYKIFVPVGSGLAVCAGLAVVIWAQVVSTEQGTIAVERNFYGVVSVKQRYSPGHELYGYALYNGDTMHGFQLRSDDKARRTPTIYYTKESGVAIALDRYERKEKRRVGVIGLGAGVLAAIGEEGDHYRFYEIDPNVVGFANEYFTFLEDSPATTEVILGDGRLAMEQDSVSQQFDVLILDAFSGDAIPTHLLTSQAFEVYRRHLRDPDNSLIVVHVSNRYLDLVPVVSRLAEHHKLAARLIRQTKTEALKIDSSDWIVITNNRQFLSDDVVRDNSVKLSTTTDVPLWTDQYSNLFQLLWKGPVDSPMSIRRPSEQ